MPLSVWPHNRHHSRALIYGDGDDDADERTNVDTQYLLLVISHIGTDITDNTHATATIAPTRPQENQLLPNQLFFFVSIRTIRTFASVFHDYAINLSFGASKLQFFEESVRRSIECKKQKNTTKKRTKRSAPSNDLHQTERWQAIVATERSHNRFVSVRLPYVVESLRVSRNDGNGRMEWRTGQFCVRLNDSCSPCGSAALRAFARPRKQRAGRRASLRQLY